jgi:hypothetical protein
MISIPILSIGYQLIDCIKLSHSYFGYNKNIMDSPKKSEISPERRFVGRKDKERLKELKRMHLEQ